MCFFVVLGSEWGSDPDFVEPTPVGDGFLTLWEPTPVGDGFLPLWEPTPVGDGFLTLWEPRPRGDGWWSARLYRDEGVAPTNTPALELIGVRSQLNC
jgi:hypothetical protein